MMATSMEADSEVLFKEKWEGNGVKAETAVDAPPSGSILGHQRRPRLGVPLPVPGATWPEAGAARSSEGSS